MYELAFGLARTLFIRPWYQCVHHCSNVIISTYRWWILLTTGWLMNNNKSSLSGLRALVHKNLGVGMLFSNHVFYCFWCVCVCVSTCSIACQVYDNSAAFTPLNSLHALAGNNDTASSFDFCGKADAKQMIVFIQQTMHVAVPLGMSWLSIAWTPETYKFVVEDSSFEHMELLTLKVVRPQ